MDRGGGFEDRLGKLGWLLATDGAMEPGSALVWLRRAAASLDAHAEKIGERTSTHVIPSPEWRAPEQLTADVPADAQTDVWAFGLLAFRLLTGERYWRARDYAALSIEVASAPLRSPSVLGAAFDAWFAQCVCRDRAHRFARVSAAAEALVAALGMPTPSHIARSSIAIPMSIGAAVIVCAALGAALFAILSDEDAEPAARPNSEHAPAIHAPSASDGRVTLHSEPSGARVLTEDGTLLGTTPLRITAPATVVVQQNGFADLLLVVPDASSADRWACLRRVPSEVLDPWARPHDSRGPCAGLPSR